MLEVTVSHLNAYLDDYAFVIQAALDLYESDFDLRWLREAEALERVAAERFEDRAEGGFFTTSSDHETLLARLKSPQDGALPAGAAVHALNLLRLAELTGRRDLAERAERTVRSMGAIANRFPAAFGQLLIAVDFLAARPREIAIAGDAADPTVRAMLATVRRRFLPQRVVAFAAPGSEAVRLPLFEGRAAADGRARAWVCRDYACLAPVEDAAALARALDD